MRNPPKDHTDPPETFQKVEMDILFNLCEQLAEILFIFRIGEDLNNENGYINKFE